MKINSIIIIFISILICLIPGCLNEDDIKGMTKLILNYVDVNSISFPNDNYNILSYSIKEDSISARGNYSLLGITK